MGRKVYLPIHEWLGFMVNVGKYTSPMDPIGLHVQFLDSLLADIGLLEKAWMYIYIDMSWKLRTSLVYAVVTS